MARQNRDLDRSASRFLSFLHRITSGIEKQQQRIVSRAANAPRIPGGPFEVIDLTGDAGNDIDYYVYELGRLDAVGDSILKIFGPDDELEAAQEAFRTAIPKLREIRNPLTHPNDNDELDAVTWFSSIVRLRPDGSVESLVDPRYEQHDAAVAYGEVLTTYLRHQVQVSITNDPAAPLTEQIRRRTQAGTDDIADDTQPPAPD